MIGPNEVAVPTHFFKVVLVENDKKPLALGTFVVPNKPLSNDTKIKDFSYSFAALEKKLGYKIFPNLATENLKDLCSVVN